MIGIDLGTSNSALAFIDTEDPNLTLRLFAIPQLTAPGKVETISTLPSFCYLSSHNEWSLHALKLPWQKVETLKDSVNGNTLIGEFAKLHGARVPTKCIQAAKSWLCNVAANRRDRILPIEAADPSLRLSPIEASSKYLLHLKEAWNALMAASKPESELEEQDITITVPASFDEVARALTLEAARAAGLQHITLLEEPQAAFYSWIADHQADWQRQFKANDNILVCDVGGGTTDFSLIQVSQNDANLTFQRMAVGEHLLLGGDNMDATLAHYLESKLATSYGATLNTDQWLQLLAMARGAKETLLAENREAKAVYNIVLQGSGASIVGNSMSVSITGAEVEKLLVDGFFGYYPIEEAVKVAKSRGVRTMGLPFEDEPSICKHLARFLQRSGVLENGMGIDYILFNGGALKPLVFQEAIKKSLSTWFPHCKIATLSSRSLDVAVAYGAAYYGKARSGRGLLIGGGLPCAYYLKIDVKEPSGKIVSKAITLLERSSKEGSNFSPAHIFALRPNTPVSFDLLVSHVRLNDRQGDLVSIDENEMQTLPPIQTVLRFGRANFNMGESSTLPVKLGIRLNAIGTIDLWVESTKSDHRWNLEFQITASAEKTQSQATINDKLFAQGYLQEAKYLISNVFQSGSSYKLQQVFEQLEKCIGLAKSDWGHSILRVLWEPLIQASAGRKLSDAHACRWWNMAGFFLRPGFGSALDDHRIKELWKIILSDARSPKSAECTIQISICLRRIAGGLMKGQQMQIAAELMASIFDKKNEKISIKRGYEYDYAEKIRALGALERLDANLKIKIGNALVQHILNGTPARYDYWALGRIGARHLLYGSIAQVLPAENCALWIKKLLHKHHPNEKNRSEMVFMLAQLARAVDYRALNLPSFVIDDILSNYPEEALREFLLKSHVLTVSEQEQAFGDSLPPGLLLEVAQAACEE